MRSPARTSLSESGSGLRYDAFFDGFPDPAFVTDVEGGFRRANTAARELFKLDPSNIHGASLLASVERESYEVVLLALRRARSIGKHSVTARFPTAPLVGATYCLMGWIAPDEDLVYWTARPSLDPGVSRSHLGRTEAAIDDDLARAVQAVRELRSDDLSPGRRFEAYDQLELTAFNQAAAIDALLDVYLVATGGLELSLEPMDLGAVVACAVESAAALSRAGGIELQRQFTPSLEVVGDPRRLLQVVINLLANALRFTPSGGVIEVSTWHSGARVMLSVRDSGCGIAPEELPLVFSCMRARSSRTSLGVGLYLVRAVVQAHGGTVQASSEGEGRGSQFVLSLPSRPVRC